MSQSNGFVAGPAPRGSARSSRLAAAILGLALAAGAAAAARAADALPDSDPSIEDILRSRPSGLRIVDGTNAEPGQWPSMVAIFMRQPSGKSANFCGGTVIDDTWVLTAAHCAVAMKRAGDQMRFFVREGTVNLGSSPRNDVPVARIIEHPQYDGAKTINDVALLQLARKANAPHQKLLSDTGIPNLVVPAKEATVIGFGLTSEGGTASADLRQTDLPIVGQPKCRAVYGDDRITDASFCAGRDEGGRDSCQGDSGGPMFRPGAGGEQIQIGVVSWGKGCGQVGYPGVYASVGKFERWVRDLVPGATFVSGRAPPKKPGGGQAEAAVDGAMTGTQTTDKPSQNAQLSVDIVQGNRLRVGSFIDIRVVSSVGGRLVLFNQDGNGRAYQIFPSKNMPSGEGESSIARIRPGRVLDLPSPRLRDQGYRFRVKPPTGDNKLIAMVLPDRAEIRDLLEQHADGSDIPDLTGLIDDIVSRYRDRGIVPERIDPREKASAERAYRIVD